MSKVSSSSPIIKKSSEKLRYYIFRN